MPMMKPGITTEEADMVDLMTKKRLRKWEGLIAEMERVSPGEQFRDPRCIRLPCSAGDPPRAYAGKLPATLGLRVVQPVVLSPFPMTALKKALDGVKTVICVEENATGQLATLAEQHGIAIQEKILRYDGRPFTYESLLAQVREVLP